MSPAGNGGNQRGIGTPAGVREHVKARERVAAARGVARARVLGHEQNREGAGHSERQRSSSELREA